VSEFNRSAKNMRPITDLVGLKKSDPSVTAFVHSLGVCQNTDSFGGLSISDYPALGLCIYFDEEEIFVTAFLYAEGCDGHTQYSGVLPHGALFTDRRADVLAKFGAPERSGPTWDRFAFVGHLVHFQYSADGATSMFTVMDPKMKAEAEQAATDNSGELRSPPCLS
jgi:hypothetical protein